jgi:hypothetical protein
MFHGDDNHHAYAPRELSWTNPGQLEELLEVRRSTI